MCLNLKRTGLNLVRDKQKTRACTLPGSITWTKVENTNAGSRIICLNISKTRKLPLGLTLRLRFWVLTAQKNGSSLIGDKRESLASFYLKKGQRIKRPNFRYLLFRTKTTKKLHVKANIDPVSGYFKSKRMGHT